MILLLVIFVGSGIAFWAKTLHPAKAVANQFLPVFTDQPGGFLAVKTQPCLDAGLQFCTLMTPVCDLK